MKITVTIEDPSAEVLALLSRTDLVVWTEGSSEDADIAESVDRAISEVVTMSGEDGPTETPKAPAEEGGPVDELIAETDAQYSRTATVAIKAGNKGKVETEVLTDDGRVGVIEACYRGRAIVSFEDGSAEVLGGSTLAVVPQGDEDPAGTPAGDQEPETTEPAAEETPRRRRRQESEPEKKEPRDEARALIYRIEKQDGGKESVLALLQEFDETATGLEALTDDEVVEVMPELKEMLA